MLTKVIAGLLAATVIAPAAHAQDGGWRDRARQNGPRGHTTQTEGDEAARPAFQRPAEAQARPQPQRPPEQARPAFQSQAQAQGGWQGHGGWRGRGDAAPPQRVEPQGQGQTQQARPEGDWRRRDQRFSGGAPQVDWRRSDAARTPPVAVEQRPDGARRGYDGRQWQDNQRPGEDRRWQDNRGRDDERRWQDSRGRGDHDVDSRRDRDWNGRSDWSRGWRDDHRYDWNRYRQQNRYVFHLPRYYAPYDWHYGYRRFSIGAVLSDLLWDQNYWIDDPFYYHLPPAYGPYRWVRYYNDALLVDIRDGQVVDVIYDIFW